MKSYLKFLSRNKLYTVVNVVGLSVSLAFVIIIGLYSQMEFGRDKWHEKAGRIFSLGLKNSDGEEGESSHWAMQKVLVPQVPDVEASCALTNHETQLTLPDQEKKAIPVIFTDQTFFQLFDFPLTLGDRTTCLSNPDDIVITEELAQLLFGKTDPMGKTVTLQDSLLFRVSGVMKALNHTYLRQADAIVQAKHFPRQYGAYDDEQMNSFGTWQVYLLARKGTNLQAEEKTMNDILKKSVWLFKDDCIFGPSQLKAYPLTELYFSKVEIGGTTTGRGDEQQSRLLFVAGLVILLFAVMNYVNLTVAQSGFRMREMATRRLLGSQRWQVVIRLIAESVMLAMLSLVVAVILVCVAAPWANELVQSAPDSYNWVITTQNSMADIIQPADIFTWRIILLLIVFTLLLGVVAGVAPAVVTSSARPIEVVRGVLQRKTKMVFSKLFIVFQHLITIVLLGVSLTMLFQVRHLLNAPLGYNHERLCEVRCNDFNQLDKVPVLVDELRKLSCIEAVAPGLGSPLHGGSNNTIDFHGKAIPFQVFPETKEWVEMLGLKVIADYGTTGEGGIRRFVTKNALTLQGLPNDARSIQFSEEKPMQVDGLIEPFHLGSVLEDFSSRPLLVMEGKSGRFMRGVALMRYSGNRNDVRRQVGEVYRRVFDLDMGDNFNFYDDQLRSCFQEHIRILRLVGVFTLCALLIAVLGLYAMSLYYLQQRRKEVAVRKAFGSTNGEVLGRLLRQFMMFVVVAFVIATPIIYYITSHWLEQFSYRIALSPWIFMVSGLTCFTISLLTVWIQSWRTANENPIKSIKTE